MIVKASASCLFSDVCLAGAVTPFEEHEDIYIYICFFSLIKILPFDWLRTFLCRCQATSQLLQISNNIKRHTYNTHTHNMTQNQPANMLCAATGCLQNSTSFFITRLALSLLLSIPSVILIASCSWHLPRKSSRYRACGLLPVIIMSRTTPLSICFPFPSFPLQSTRTPEMALPKDRTPRRSRGRRNCNASPKASKASWCLHPYTHFSKTGCQAGLHSVELWEQ